MKFTYLIIKPDGLPLTEKICRDITENDIEIVKKYKVDNFDKLSIPLYLDSDAVERGNTPIIIGINEIFKQYYGTEAIILLLNTKRNETKEDFIVRVCRLKKFLRAKYIKGGYRAFEGVVTDEDYKNYGLEFSRQLAEKRCISHENGYRYLFQVNCIHSPDDMNAYNREIKVLAEHGIFNNQI